jgi:hypothetical protein
MFLDLGGMKVRQTALISILLFILYCGGAAAVLEGTENVTSIVVRPAGEEIEGDPDHPIITGVGGPAPETTGIEHEDIGIVDDSGEEGAEPVHLGLDIDGEDEEQERKESGEKAGTEDINIGVGEMQETGINNKTRGIEHEDIGIADREVESEEAGTPEIDDEVLVTFGDGERGAFRVEVRGWNPKDKEAAKTQYSESDLNFILTRAARNEGDLEEYTKALSQSDPNIENIIVTESVVAMDYRFPAKLLGLIDLDYTYHAEVDAFGRIKVKLPWWLFLTNNNAGDVTSDLEEELSTVGDDAQLANIDLQNTLQKQQQTLQTMSNVSKAAHDTAMAIIRKIG